MKKILSIVAIILFGWVPFCHGLAPETHEAINERVAKDSFEGFSLDVYLKEQLGLQNGIETTIDSYKIWWWLKSGGLYEDVPAWYMPYIRLSMPFRGLR